MRQGYNCCTVAIYLVITGCRQTTK